MEQPQSQPQPTTEKGWVRVSKIAPAATKEELVNLFGFCGYVSGINLYNDPDGSGQIAIIEFLDKSAVTTACLLSSAVIQAQPIQVELWIADDADQTAIATSNTTSPGAPPLAGDPLAKQNKTAVLAQMFASGIILAHDVKAKAIAWDSGNLTLVQKLEALGTVAILQAGLINEKYHLSEKKDEFIAAAEKKALEIKATLEANQNVQIAKTKVLEIDSRYGISSKAVNLFETAKAKATEIKEQTQAEIARREELAKQQQQTAGTGAPPPSVPPAQAQVPPQVAPQPLKDQ